VQLCAIGLACSALLTNSNVQDKPFLGWCLGNTPFASAGTLLVPTVAVPLTADVAYALQGPTASMGLYADSGSIYESQQSTGWQQGCI
jgi:hypothetical protein